MAAIDCVFDIIAINKYLSIQKSYRIYFNLLGASFMKRSSTRAGFFTFAAVKIRSQIVCDPCLQSTWVFCHGQSKFDQ